MFNEELLSIVEKKCGAFWKGEASDELIEKLCTDLNVKLSDSYKAFLKRFGEGGISGSYINGIGSERYSAAQKDTLKFREKINISINWIVIQSVKTEWERYLICLDTSRMKNNECPLIKYDLDDKTIEDVSSDFYEFFNNELQIKFDTRCR